MTLRKVMPGVASKYGGGDKSQEPEKQLCLCPDYQDKDRGEGLGRDINYKNCPPPVNYYSHK